MYDLKTATRLYILEGHRKRLAGISFSPDGRRLVTLGLEESVVLVWKVGSSFTSFFHPGAPPRQGHAGSDPYKTLNFVLVGGSEYRCFSPLFVHPFYFELLSEFHFIRFFLFLVPRASEMLYTDVHASFFFRLLGGGDATL